jgi:electron-transferring-flavoprotein dehydrogenase
MKSGMLAAEAAFDALTGSSSAAAADLEAYEDSMRDSWVWEELTKERNIRPSCVPAPISCYYTYWPHF